MSSASSELIFSGNTRLGSPKKRVLPKKIFSFEFKEKQRASDMQLLGPQQSH
jgi:hypothetical protein